jgi:hypothetical protein
MTVKRSYENNEVLKLLKLSGVLKDFNEDLPIQWKGIQDAYRRDFPNHLTEFSFFLDTNLYEIEIESAKHRYGEKILAEFSEVELQEINNFYHSEFGKRILKLSELMRVELRNERTKISVNIGGKLEASACKIKKK